MKFIKGLYSQYEANPDKGIILLHDAGGNRQATVDALPRIIHYFKSHNIQFISISSIYYILQKM